MNEEALIDAYNLFKRNGYGDSIEDFKVLISKNPQALKDSYSLFVGNGYGDSIEDYKKLLGVGAAPVVKKKSALDSSSEAGSLVSQESTRLAPQVDGEPPVKPMQKLTKEAFGKAMVEAPKTDAERFVKEFEQRPEVQKITATIKSKEAEKKKYADIYDNQLSIKPTVEDSKYLKDRLSTINTELINKEEEYVVPELQYQFGDLGFKFEESGATGDYVKVTAPNGKTTEISLDNFLTSKSKTESEILKKFIKENTPSKGLFVLEKTMKEQDIKFNSEKQVEDSIKSISDELSLLNNKQKDFLVKRNELEKQYAELSRTPISQRNTQEFIDKLSELDKQKISLDSEMKSILVEEEKIKQKSKKLDSAVGKYSISKAKQGTWLGGIWNAINEGASSITAGITSLITDLATEIMPSGYGMNPEELKSISSDISKKIGVNGPSETQTLEEWKKTLTDDQLDKWEDEVDDYIKKDLKTKLLPAIRVGNREIYGDPETTKQWSKLKEEDFWGGAILGVAKSIPAIIGGTGPAGWAQRTAQMYAQVSDGLAQEMEANPEFKDISETEKLAVTLPIGIVGAVLEEIGLRNIKGSQGVINGIALRVLGKSGKGVTAKTFRELVEDEVNGMVSKGLLTITAAGAAEFETGAAQELAETGFKAIYNEIKDKEMFDTPESTVDLIENVVMSGAQEAVGGFVLGVPSSVSAAFSEKGFLKMDDTTFETFANMANDEKMQSAYISSLKDKITTGVITTADAKNELNNYRNSVGLFRQLPDGLTIRQKKEAMNLLKEKRDLETYVQGKEPALVVKQKNRINEINDSLTKISEETPAEYIIDNKKYTKEEFFNQLQNKTQDELKAMNIVVNNDEQTATEIEKLFEVQTLKTEEDAIQKQAAGQVPVQPTTRVGETMEEGKPQAKPEVTTEEGVQEEVAAPQTIINPTQLEDLPTDVKMTTEFTQEDGTVSPVIGNEKMLSDMYTQAMATPETERTQPQVQAISVVETLTPIIVNEAQVVTHRQSGGSSINQKGQNLIGKDGYSVSIHTDRTQTVDGKDITSNQLKDYKEANKDLLEDPKNFVGTWYDKDSGKTYLDISTFEADLETAKKMGRKANQKAIYDLKNQVEIDTGGTGEVVVKETAKDLLDNYSKGTIVSIEELSKKAKSKDTIINNVLSKMKYMFNSIKISGRRPGEGAAFYNNDTKQIDINKNSTHWKEVEGDDILGALSHEYTHHLINESANKDAIEQTLQEIKDDLIANPPLLTPDQKFIFDFMVSKNNSPQEILTYAVSHPIIRPVLVKYKTKINQVSNNVIGEDVISISDVEISTKIKAEQEAEQLGNLISGTDAQIDQKSDNIKNKKLSNAVAKAAKSLSKILPNVKFVVHDTDESYRKATDEEGRSQSSMGEYNPKTKTIHINGTKANNRTIAHEAFHAILLDRVQSEKQAADVTKRMIEAISKKIEANPKLKNYLDDFAANYEENIQNEEKLAELVGVLSENYQSQTQTVKDIIKRWLNKLSQMFGLSPITSETEVMEVLNTIARKVATGKAIKESDVESISILDNGTNSIGSPTEIRLPIKRKSKITFKDRYENSLVTPDKKIDIYSLLENIVAKKQKVWFWVADQLGINKDLGIDGGPSFAHQKDGDIWASSVSTTEIQKNINESEYIFIISGSPQLSKLFNKKVFDLMTSKLGDYKTFKETILSLKPTKDIKEVLEAHSSWDSLRNDTSVDSTITNKKAQEDLVKNGIKNPTEQQIKEYKTKKTKIGTGRKKFLNSLVNINQKPNAAVYKYISSINGHTNINDLRDGFYRDNNFEQNDIMLVLKPTGVRSGSEHSTYENTIEGEVIGVPDAKINALEVMPKEMADKYVEKPAQASQAIAPYGSGIKEISPIRRKQLIGENANLSQNVRDNLQVARNMEDIGKSVKDIRIATGWERGADKKWRYEVYDDIPFFKNIFSAINKLLNEDKFIDGLSVKGNNFLPKELLNLYPNLGDINFEVIKTGDENEATYNPKTKTIKVSLGIYPTNTISSLLHEIQHVIQDEEGFAKGGNLSSSALMAILSLEDNLGKNLENATRSDIVSLKLNKEEEVFRNFVLDTFYSKEGGDSESLNKNAYKIYKKLGGEVESRNVEKRMKMTPEKRRKTTLQETEDVAREDQIIFFENKGISTRKQVEFKARRQEPVAGNKLFNEPLQDATTIAERYAKKAGIDMQEVTPVRSLDKENSKAIAKEFDKMKDDPNDPEVAKAYKAMADETIEQYKEIIKDGYVVEINNNEPYSSSDGMIKDLRDNKRMKIFSTVSGFGNEPITDQQRKENPLLRDSGFKDVNGQTLLVNDVFRFVHDFFGHAKIGNSFGPIGEENAWLIHSAMYTPLARRAMTSETRGQNSWVNFSGVNDEAFKLRDKARELRKEGKTEQANELVGKVYDMMKFADQKIGLMPEWVSGTGSVESAMDVRKQNTSDIDNIVKIGKQNNFSDAGIRQYLKQQGYSDREATNAINKYNVKEEGIFIQSEENLGKRIKSSIDSLRRRFLSARSFLPKSVFAYKEQKEAFVAAHLNIVDQNVTDFNRLYNKFQGDKDQLVKDFDAYLTGDNTISLPVEFMLIANRMRNQIDSLSQMLIDNGLVDVEMANTIRQNLGKYLTRDYEIYKNDNWKDKVQEEVKQKAINLLRIQYLPMAQDIATKEGIPVDEVLDRYVNNRLDELLNKGGATNFVKGSRLGSKDLSVLKERQDIPFEIRALMGEYGDPAMNYSNTVLKLSSLAANHNFLTQVKEAGMEKYFFEKNDPRRPKEFNTQIAVEGSETMNPLNGLYTTKEIAEAFQAQQRQLGDLMEAFMKLQSIVRYGKTILSAGTHIKNVLGNLGFVWANGHYTDMDKAYSIVKNDLLKANNQEKREMMDNYIRLGIVKQSAGIGEIMDMFKDANFSTAMASRLNNKKLGLLGKAKRKLFQAKKFVEDLYQAEDDFFKVVAYENELRRYSKALFNKSKKDLTPKELDQVNKVVTEIVKNTYPTYSRIPEAIKMIRRFPFIGNFVSFQAEAYRTAFNTMALAKDEIISDNPEIRKIGAMRLAGATTYISAKTAVLQYFGMAVGTGLTGVFGYLFDDDDEEEKDKNIREFVAPWSKKSDLLVLSAGDGKLKYIDFSASDPHGGIKKAINAFLLGESTTDSFIDAVVGVLEPFIGEEMTTSTILSLKNNRDKNGNQIWNPEDTDAEKMNAILGEVYKLMEPGTASSIRRGIASEDKANELIANITGFRTYDVDVNKQFGFKIKDYSERIKDARRLYNSVLYKKESTEEDKKNALNKADKALKEIYGEISTVYNSAEKLGVKPEDLKNSMKTFGGMGKDEITKIQSGKIPSLKQDIEQEQYKESLLIDKQSGIRYDNQNDMKRYNRNLWEKNFGEGSDYYKSKEGEREERKRLREEKDEEYGYTPKKKKNKDGSRKRGYDRRFTRGY